MAASDFDPQDVLELWFPDTGHQQEPEAHAAFWDERMQGGIDARILADFSEVTLAAAMGELDHWAAEPRGRLALLIALDQFSRSLWRDTPQAYAQDIKATRLVFEGVANGHYDALAPWEQGFFHIANSHCEGPGHLQRLDRMEPLIGPLIAAMPEPIRLMADGFREQHERVCGVIARFGRHPHRNAILGRLSTAEEKAYIAAGDFPHVKKAAPD